MHAILWVVSAFCWCVFCQDFDELNEVNRAQEVTKEDLNLLFEAANWAPCHGKTEPWRFVVVPQDCVSQYLEIERSAWADLLSDQPEKLEKCLSKVGPSHSLMLTRPCLFWVSFDFSALYGHATASCAAEKEEQGQSKMQPHCVYLHEASDVKERVVHAHVGRTSTFVQCFCDH